MKIIQPSWHLVRATHELEEVLEVAGRVCYKSEDKICEGSAAPFVSSVQAQLARDVLPNSLKTEIVVSANPREWKHIFKLRAAKAAHPQMRQIMVPMAMQFHLLWPSIFDPVEV